MIEGLKVLKSNEYDFLSLCDQVVAKINKRCSAILPYDEKSCKYFNNLNTHMQEYICQSIKEYLGIINEWEKETEDSKQLVWYALKSMKLRPSSDFFTFLEDGDIIEVYSPDFKQIFRNFEFFKISSYPVSYSYLFTWSELYKRETAITDQIASYGIQLFSGKIKNTIKSRVPAHTLEEIFSEDKLTLLMEQKVFSPLFDANSNIGAVAATSKVEIINFVV